MRTIQARSWNVLEGSVPLIEARGNRLGRKRPLLRRLSVTDSSPLLFYDTRNVHIKTSPGSRAENEIHTNCRRARRRLHCSSRSALVPPGHGNRRDAPDTLCRGLRADRGRIAVLSGGRGGCRHRRGWYRFVQCEARREVDA